MSKQLYQCPYCGHLQPEPEHGKPTVCKRCKTAFVAFGNSVFVRAHRKSNHIVPDNGKRGKK